MWIWRSELQGVRERTLKYCERRSQGSIGGLRVIWPVAPRTLGSGRYSGRYRQLLQGGDDALGVLALLVVGVDKGVDDGAIGGDHIGGGQR